MSIITHIKTNSKVLKLIKRYYYKRLKKWCVLSFLRKLVREKISLMSDGSAFQARDPAMENNLSRYMKTGT